MDLDIARLQEAITSSEAAKEPFAAVHLANHRKYLGPHYGAAGVTVNLQPVPTVGMFVDIVSRFLVSGEPKVLVTTEPDMLKSRARDFELWLNKKAREMRVKDEVALATDEALLGFGGIVKVGAEPGYLREPFNLIPDILYPYARQVDFMDIVWDMTVKRRRDVGFIAHKFDLPEDIAKSVFRKESLSQLSPEDYRVDDGGTGQSEDPTVGESAVKDPFIKRIVGREVFLPYHKKTVWLPKSGTTVLAEEDWAGPLHESDRIIGPYHFLILKETSNNIMPIPPVLDLLDLDELLNLIYSKIQVGIAEHRHNVVTRNKQDAERIQQADPYEVVHIENSPDMALKDFEIGGPNAQFMAAGMHIKQILNWVAGNMDLLGGLGQAADTATQERMLASTSSKKLESWQARAVDFVRGIYYDLGFYEVNDPLAGGEVWKEYGGFRVSKQITPFTMKQDFQRMNFAIDPYSVQEHSPRERAMMLEQTVMSLLTGLQQSMMQQGVTIDVEALVKILARYKNQPELTDIIKFLGVSDSATQAPQRQSGPASTTREHIRRNVSDTGQPDDQSILAMAQSGANRG